MNASARAKLIHQLSGLQAKLELADQRIDHQLTRLEDWSWHDEARADALRDRLDQIGGVYQGAVCWIRSVVDDLVELDSSIPPLPPRLPSQPVELAAHPELIKKFVRPTTR